jgi:hypothetical protein
MLVSYLYNAFVTGFKLAFRFSIRSSVGVLCTTFVGLNFMASPEADYPEVNDIVLIVENEKSVYPLLDYSEALVLILPRSIELIRRPRKFQQVTFTSGFNRLV